MTPAGGNGEKKNPNYYVRQSMYECVSVFVLLEGGGGGGGVRGLSLSA